MKNRRLSFEKSKAFTRRIEQVIPGGAHTYSKGRDQFPLEAPNGIVRGKGARVWDADGNELIDWSMSLTAVCLGYADERVDAAVIEEIGKGVNFHRPGQIELEAAEAFIDFAGTDMVKFAKHGSVVTTAAVKLARAHTGRRLVAVPRQQPFFSFDDWFIGTTPADFGIPDELKRFTLLFDYGDADSLEALFEAHRGEIACVMLEPVKFDPPPEGFLERVRRLCTDEGAVLVLDEMVSGLKWGVPGASAYFGVEADLYTYGKGISNGYAATALTGRREIMELGGLERDGQRKLFLLSSTHGAESSGLAAMIATLDILRDGEAICENWRRGEALRARLDATTERHGLSDRIFLRGGHCLIAVDLRGPDGEPDDAFRTLFMQEMIASGLLFQGLFFPTPSHGEAELSDTETAWDRACEVYGQALEAGTVEGLLIGPPVKPVFRRYI
ncbi:MAG: glutamate-1-semialdehyde 2,1-aminomutase [Kiloniellales bacterium]